MAYVNLLPWRQQERMRARNRFLLKVGATIAVAALVAFLIKFSIGEMRYQQQSRNQYLQQHIEVLDIQLAEISALNKKKDSILQRMALIQALHEERNSAVTILNELAELAPEGLYLVNVEKRLGRLYIDGRSASNNRVSEFLRALSEQGIFSDIKLQQVVADQQQNSAYDAFSLSASVNLVVTADAAETTNGD